MTREQIDTLVEECGEEEILLADGFEDAFLGIARQFNKAFATYDYEKCIGILMKRDGMSHEESVEFFDFNVQGAYVGENTPAFLTRSSS